MRRTVLKTLAAVSLGLAFSASAWAADPAKKEIVIGTTVGDFGDMVKQSIKPILEKKGYSVKLVEFTDYVRPNLALQEGSLDVNVFQHKPYLDNFAKEHNLSLTPVFQVPTAPLGIYPGKLKSLKDVKAGSTLAAPNDPTNFARALVMLNDLGWVKLKPGINPLTASEHDIAQNVKNVKIVPLEAAQLPRSRGDVDFSVINGNYATSSGIKLTEAIYQEKSYAYVNWGVVRSADVQKPWVKDVVAAYKSPEFKAWAKQKYAGYKLPADWK
ncbi:MULTISPECIES: MetQ/NlpA family ABC transporter substrate-binding protein [Gulbenkiania]|uniref:Lipoprotein n=2 Tax=Gulbenkiania TaxID=397456 RepID=A0A0K6H3Y2_9NEIS|nr:MULTISPECIES: MetQ/NlpA family ABC transporter substrate-binding protein [Gulbenkiania]TCW30258.1 D-methionine transport system substrate-binding protein [Gulbenkiania mobilis]CUA85454.1 ABC-type metal ion transport system, periplasmic component/surface antigen [Gulbenkiania indica]